MFNTFKFKYLSVPQFTTSFSDISIHNQILPPNAIVTCLTLPRIGSDLETIVANQKAGGLQGCLFNACPKVPKFSKGERIEGTESDVKHVESGLYAC